MVSVSPGRVIPAGRRDDGQAGAVQVLGDRPAIDGRARRDRQGAGLPGVDDLQLLVREDVQIIAVVLDDVPLVDSLHLVIGAGVAGRRAGRGRDGGGGRDRHGQTTGPGAEGQYPEDPGAGTEVPSTDCHCATAESIRNCWNSAAEANVEGGPASGARRDPGRSASRRHRVSSRSHCANRVRPDSLRHRREPRGGRRPRRHPMACASIHLPGNGTDPGPPSFPSWQTCFTAQPGSSRCAGPRILNQVCAVTSMITGDQAGSKDATHRDESVAPDPGPGRGPAHFFLVDRCPIGDRLTMSLSRGGDGAGEDRLLPPRTNSNLEPFC